MATCVCGSTKDSAQCCAKYIHNSQAAPDPESLMRTRYTAYTELNMAYIAKTMQGPALAGFDPQSALEWAKQIKWLRLQVLNASIPIGNKAYVEFIAHYLFQGRRQSLHEISEFHCIEGHWYYVDGKIVVDKA